MHVFWIPQNQFIHRPARGVHHKRPVLVVARRHSRPAEERQSNILGADRETLRLMEQLCLYQMVMEQIRGYRVFQQPVRGVKGAPFPRVEVDCLRSRR